jgi:signal transduction histidine kinase
MKFKLILAPLIFLLACGLAQAQDKTATEPVASVQPARVDLPAEVQQAVSAHSATIRTAQSELRAAQSQLKTAQLEFENLILRLRIVLKIPDDFEVRVDKEGKLYFEKAAATAASAPAPPKKP